jgi:hypothetical protein
MTVSHDFSAIDSIEREFSQKREEEHRSTLEREISPVRAQETEANGRAQAHIIQAQAERRKKTGYAALASGIGIGAAALGLSYLLPPKIVETTKVITETKTVEVPKIVEIPKVIETTKVIETPKSIETTPPLPPITPPPTSTPQIGEHTSTENFTNSDEYKNTLIKGKIIYHRSGEIKFDNGKSFFDLQPNGLKDISVNNTRHDGDFGYCAQTGQRLPNGTELYNCRALHNGVVEPLTQGATMPPNFPELSSSIFPQNPAYPPAAYNQNKPKNDIEDAIDKLFDF